ncbi:hypothetical protein ACH5RR_033518 [Cinchona calisaya]|uniref:Bet v I/Major latex protein domain-containing protein n=1 Tax=Cinchona calisaya TaxID=153742 RepID=A0ABD2YN90_9GENT
MGAVKFSDEVSSSIPAPKLFKAFVLDADNLIPKIVPQAFNNVQLLQGDGGPGSIKQTNFGEGSQHKYVKHRIDALDKENFYYAYTLIEGAGLMDKIESVSYEMKIEGSPEGGSIVKNTRTYHTKPGSEMNEEEIKAGMQKAAGIFKLLEAYLLANPEAYA